jgi:predicted transcriptional regulator
MHERYHRLAINIATVESALRRQYSRSLARDRTLQRLIADLVAARTAAGMTQEDVAARMSTTKSVVSRLESGRRTRPTLKTIQKYALAVGAQLEIRVRSVMQ